MVELILILFGLVMGSFLNVVIYRLPRGESLILPPSHCPHCGYGLKAMDLVPVLSYSLLRGRCRSCKAAISPRYPIVELLTAALTLGWWYKYGIANSGWELLLLIYVLIAVAFIDWDHQIIPNRLTISMMIFGLTLKEFQGDLIPALLGMAAGGGLLFVIAMLYPKGMGMGDVKFLGMTGIFLGWQKVLVSLFLGSLIGVLVIIPLMILGKIDRKTPFPFGPFLVIATLILIFGDNNLILLLYQGG